MESWIINHSLPSGYWKLNNEDFDRLSHAHIKYSLSNRRIVFIGDSITRYQYLNLAHYLHTNSWFSSAFPKLENEKEWPSWKSFLLGSSFRFGCKEICNCYRTDNITADWTIDWKENRHFFDEQSNIEPPNTSNFAALCSSAESLHDMLTSYNSGSETAYNIVDFLDVVIRNKRPDAVIINQGLWEFPALRNNDTYIQSFVASLKNSATEIIWKTTTARCFEFYGNTRTDDDVFLEKLRRHGIVVFDAYKLTREVAAVNNQTAHNVCWDEMHFQPFVYREINKKLLKFLIDIIGGIH